MGINQINQAEQRYLPIGDLPYPDSETLDVWLVDIDTATFTQNVSNIGKDRHEFIKQRRFSQRFYTRLILSAYLSIPAAKLPLIYTLAGKPILQPLASPLHFNLSHSRRWLALAISSVQTVGIDIECQRENNDPLALSARYFSEQEHNWLLQQTAAQLQIAFNRIWVRKEAALKNIGLGLAGNISSAVCGISNKYSGEDATEIPDQVFIDQSLLSKENTDDLVMNSTVDRLNIVSWEIQELDIQTAIAIEHLPKTINSYQLTCKRS